MKTYLIGVGILLAYGILVSFIHASKSPNKGATNPIGIMLLFYGLFSLTSWLGIVLEVAYTSFRLVQKLRGDI